MAEDRARGVYERHGKCQIKWQQGQTSKTELLPIPYTKTGIAKARRVRALRIEAYETGIDSHSGFTPAPTLIELAQRYLDDLKLKATRSSYKTIRGRLNNYWIDLVGEYAITSIKRRHIQEVIRKSRRNGNKEKHTSNIVSAGSAVFELAITEEWISENPCANARKRVKVGKEKIDPYTQEEIDAVAKKLNGNDKLFFAIRWYC